MKPGDRIIVVAHWSSFRGMKGVVVAMVPPLMVLIDGDKYPIRIEAKSVVIDEPSSLNLTGAE